MTDHRLPADFLVGAATAAHQIEGGNVNADFWHFEHAADSPMHEPSGDAADSFHRWEDDLDLAAGLGFNAYRFSIEWARIEPAPGEISRAAIQHYGRIIDRARARGLEPVVTLHHFTLPLWCSKAGGWSVGETADRFNTYVTALRSILEPVRWVVTINEPNMVALMARFLPDLDGSRPTLDIDTENWHGPLPAPDPAARDGLIRAHRAAVDTLRAQHPGLLVGWSIANQVVQSTPGGEDTAGTYVEAVEDAFLRVSRDDDFVGVQSYGRTLFGPDGVVRDDPEDQRTLTGMEYYPAALGEAVRHTRSVVGEVPILVTENGIATDNDDRRLAYTHGALEGLLAAMADGVDVRGYLHWSLLDNYEWGSYKPRFGLASWDRETFDRTAKPSAHWLGAVARTGALVPVDDESWRPGTAGRGAHDPEHAPIGNTK